MPLTYPQTGHWNITRPIQYTIEGTTPATYGVTPTSSPSFTVAGAIQEIQDIPIAQSFIKRQLGKREYYKNLLTKHMVTFELKFAPYNITLMNYGAAVANGAGTVDESLTFMKAKKVNVAGTLTEQFYLYKGCVMGSLDINVAGKEVEVTSQWVAQQKTGPAAHGLTTPTLRTFSDVSSTPWTHLDNGTNPLTINAVTYPCTKFHINFNNNLAIDDDVNGDDLISKPQQGNRDITGDFEVIVGKDFALEGSVNSGATLPAYSASYVLKTATATITLTDLSIKQYTEGEKSDESKSTRIPFTFEASNAVIA